MERLRIRPYRSTDFDKIHSWITDEESHLKWCANTIPFEYNREMFENILQEALEQYGDVAYTATDEKDVPVGFFRFSVNQEENTGFFKCIVVDGNMRGVGLGKKMLTKAVKNAFEIADVSEVRLIVFDDNPAAVSCYAKVGFEVETVIEPLEWNGKKWNRTRLINRRDI